MVDTEIICTVLGIIANFISLGLLACAVLTFHKIVKINSVEGIKPVYRLALTMSSLFLVLYGMPFTHPGYIPVSTANGIILATQIAYLIIFLFYANNNKQKMYVGGVFLFELVVFSLVIGLVFRLAPTVEFKSRELSREFVVGMICFASTALARIPEVYMLETMSTGSIECMQPRIVVGNTLYCLCWTIYASLKFEMFFSGMNFVGLIWGVVQLKVYDVYYKRCAKSGADKKLDTAEVQLQDKKLLGCTGKEWAQV